MFGNRLARMMTGCLAAACLSADVVARQAAPAGEFQLARIDVAGARRYTAADVARVSGLKTGQRVTVESLTAVAQRMGTTGLFKSVRYRYVTAGTQLTLTFEIEEEAWTKPVVFDNFVWFSDDELKTALAQEVPSFDGTAPANQGASGFIAQALQRLLDARRFPGRVEFISRLNMRSRVEQHVFVVKDAGGGLKVCALRVSGAAAVPEGELQQAAQDVIGTDYSRSYMTDIADGTLRQVYRRQGHWRAEFGPVSASTPDGAGCPGITVTLSVVEGPAYTWDRPVWIGNAAITGANLEGPLGMKPGEIADLSRIESGLRAVHGAYEKQGYLSQTAAIQPKLDDATRRAAFEIRVTEGPQFHMGVVTFAGLSPADAAELTKKWRLKSGDVYDASYLATYRLEHLRGLRGAGGAPVRFTPELRIDRVRHVVDVRFVVGQPPVGAYESDQS
jgi:outer membrane protein assembly factor BamA